MTDEEKLKLFEFASTFTIRNSRFQEQILFLESRPSTEEGKTWIITDGSHCVYNHDGDWEWEPLPSNQDDEHKKRCRYSLEEAFVIAQNL